MNTDLIKAVIFDCDGVMFDSQKANTAYYNRILNHLGAPDMSPSQFDFVHMHTVDEALGHLKTSTDPEALKAAVSGLHEAIAKKKRETA